MADLAAEPFVTFPLQMNSRILDLLKTACAGAGFAPRVAQEGGQLHTLLSLVSAGLGVTLVPKWVALLPQPGVVFRDLADFATPYELLLAWKDDEPNPSAVTFRQVAQDVVQMIQTSAPRIERP
jgi:DNA-binding transcriptional LysR family regulator